MMSKQSLFDRLKEFIGNVAFDVFLWSVSMTNEQYWRTIYLQEKRYIENNGENIA